MTSATRATAEPPVVELGAGDAFCAGEMRRQELSGSVQCSSRFVEDRIKGLEDVRHPRGDVEGNLDVGAGSSLRQADGVVEENLMSSGLDDQGRQTGQVGEYGADRAKSGVLSRRMVGDGDTLQAWGNLGRIA